MKNPMLIFAIILSGLICGCSRKEQYNQQDKNRVIAIDMTSTRHSDRIFIDNLLKDLSFVKLENHPDSYIKEASRIKVVKNRIFIFDQIQNKLFIFTINGKYIAQAITRGKGPGEVALAKDFDVDIENEILLVLELSKKALLAYDFDGNYLRTIKIGSGSLFFACTNDDTYAFYIGYYDPSYANLHLTAFNGINRHLLFPFPKDIVPLNFKFSGFVTRNHSGILYNAACTNEIYQVKNDGSTYLKYKIDFGAKSWPENRKYDFQGFLQSMSRFDIDFLMNRFEENSEGLIFPYQSGHREYRGFYLKSTNTVYHINDNLVNDVFFNVLSNPRGVTENDLFISVMEPALVRDKIIEETNSGKTVTMNERLKKEILASTDSANLLLIFYSLGNPKK
jgi:hypothetical protein